MTRLTKTRIDKLKPDPSREAFEWCVDPRRFGVRVSPTGRKTFVIQYTFHGRTRRYAIGTFGSITVDQARARAKDLFSEIAKGVDPSRERRVNRSAPSISELADRYMAEHARVHKRPSSIRTDEHNIKKHVKPRLGRLRVVDVTRQDLASFHSNMSEHPIAANRCLALIGKMSRAHSCGGLGKTPQREAFQNSKSIAASVFSAKWNFRNLAQRSARQRPRKPKIRSSSRRFDC